MKTQHIHLWTNTSPMRCVKCGKPVLSWWRRIRQRVALWTALARSAKRWRKP